MTRSTTGCRRKQHRFRIKPGVEALLEFDWPQPNGAPISTRLADISLSGLSFHVPDSIEGLDLGASICEVTVHVGRIALRGDLTVMHVTPERSICGALFHPATDLDLIQLRSMMAGIEAADSD